MKNALLILSFLIGIQSFSQGIQEEIGINDSYHQTLEGNVVCTETHSYLTHVQSGLIYFSPTVLTKVDLSGNIVWKKNISPTVFMSGSPTLAEVSTVFQMEEAKDGGLIITGYGRAVCDVAGGESYFVRKLDQNGDEVWINRLEELASGYPNIEELIVSGNDIYVQAKFGEDYKYLHFEESTGNLIVSFENDLLLNYLGFEKIGEYYCGITEAGIVRVNSNGEIHDTIPETIEAGYFLVNGEEVFVYNNSNVVKTYDLDFNELKSEEINLNGEPQRFKIINDTYQILSADENSYQVTVLSEDLELISAHFYSQPESYQPTEKVSIDFNDSQIGVGLDHDLFSLYRTVRFINYSREATVDETIERIDVELSDFEAYNFEYEHFNGAPDNIFDIKIYGQAKIKNNSNYILESCRFNHFVSHGIACGDDVYSQRFDGLNLAPGESMWVDLGLFHTDVSYLPISNDSIYFNLCVFTSSPNDMADLITENDKFCGRVYGGTVGLEENTLNYKKKVVKIVNLLGQEVKPEPNKLLIYIFDDGTSEKRILTE